ncbi:collagen-binding domain-containing protein [Pseudoruegeria sp. SK021]|uniref:collagen-binding domain-containing protein n=1 Tax=Pseudoruegeria sp. SK021 TaxID=1933035 RepID=UPI000A23A7D8|nr:collagen-binding domain-containing protein [Pseudoruegeria sp. SK021]OSP54993.1 hypothetical protein BV911_10115 [Pseudoruegeria sp. SK021]
MSFSRVFTGLIAGVALSPVAFPLAASAASIDINTMANGFGVIALNSFTSTSINHIEGPVYAGGNASGTNSMTFNDKNLSDVAVGDVTGALVVGGDYNGDLNSGGFGSIVVGGTVNGDTSNLTVPLTTGATIDTAGVSAAFNATATALSGMGDSTGASFDGDQNAQYNFVSGAADANGLAVLNLDETEAGAFFTGSNDLKFDIDGSVSTFIINVAGSAFDITKSFNNNAGVENIMFNFFEATTLSLNSTWNTSLMATNATLTTNVDVRGTFIVEDFVATNFEVRPFQSNSVFTGTLPAGEIAPVPLPAALPLALSGVIALGALRRSRRKAA